jgi:hypothetical protein
MMQRSSEAGDFTLVFLEVGAIAHHPLQHQGKAIAFLLPKTFASK